MQNLSEHERRVEGRGAVGLWGPMGFFVFFFFKKVDTAVLARCQDFVQDGTYQPGAGPRYPPPKTENYSELARYFLVRANSYLILIFLL